MKRIRIGPVRKNKPGLKSVKVAIKGKKERILERKEVLSKNDQNLSIAMWEITVYLYDVPKPCEIFFPREFVEYTVRSCERGAGLFRKFFLSPLGCSPWVILLVLGIDI